MNMLKTSFLIAAALVTGTAALAQNNYTEKVIPLSKQASKGYLYDWEESPDGGLELTFKYSEKKKEGYEKYSVDKTFSNVNQSLTETVKDRSVVKENYSKTWIYAEIGGSNSFDVLSTKLKLFKVAYEYKWNKEKQRYYRSQTNREKVTIKNVDDKSYEGFIDFGNSDNGELMVLTAVSNKKEKNFFLLNVKTDLSFKETPFNLGGNHTLVYAGTVQSKITNDDDEFDIAGADMVFIFAPVDKSPDLKKYTYIRVDNKGTIVDQFTFQAPSPNLLITEAKLLPNGNIMLFGAYTKSKDAFEDVFGEYGPIVSPGFLATDNTGNQNLRMTKYNKHVEDENMLAMVVMSMKKGGVEWQREVAVKEMESKLKKAPEQKKAPVYNGKAFKIQQFDVMPNGDMLVAGQLTGRVSMGLGNPMKSYKQLICFHFAKDGNLKAQYGYEPESIDDKQNVIYPIIQQFIPSADGKTAYWMVLENISVKGYESFMDAYNGSVSYYPVYYPSIIKINIENATISNMEELGKRKYRLNRKLTYIYQKESKSIVFVGRDEDNKTLWLCKYHLN
ncbi:MAG: hypothetical protein K1X81_07725 [Bacteroidia bacterium]|nr:hypothetical protein [Bacteroidia bacterium]